jgi:class 3 adenylate cyclase
MDIAGWLRSLGLEQYAAAFRNNEIDATVLPNLTAEDLKDLGVGIVGHRRRLLDAIASLRADAAVDKALDKLPKNTAERRQVTVLFSDLVGSTALAASMDPEDLREVIAAYQKCVAEAVRQFGGFVAKFLGDGVLVYFGYPQAHEDDAERAVRAGLQIVAAVAALRTRGALQTRVGIATGVVIIGDLIGSGEAQERGIVGETPNLAARLQGLAEPNTIVIAPSTKRLTGQLFEYRDLGHHPLKGFTEPVAAWGVLGIAADHYSVKRSGRGAFAGRRLELAQLQSIFGTCGAQRRGSAVHIRGEAGIGKTRLLEEALAIARRQGFACHTGWVLDFGTGVGRDAMASIARDMLGLQAKADAGAAPAIGRISESDTVFINDLLQLPQPTALRSLWDAMDNATRAEGKRRTMARLIDHASHAQPRVLAVEDLHWADSTMLAQLADLASAVAGCPAVLIMTSRFEQDLLDHRWRARAGNTPLIAIDLGPLHAEEVAVIAAPFLTENREVVRDCVDRAAGNPLFLEQLLQNAAEGDGGSIPGSVRSLVQARLDRLEPMDRAALQAASVLGQRFDRGALAYLLDVPSFEGEQLLARSLLHARGEELLFAHALIHEAVYDGLLKSRRRELHQRAAQWFAQRDAMLYASHLDRAADPGAARAYFDAASAQRREYRHEAARRLAERGLALATDENDRFALSCLLGDIFFDLADMPAALAAFTGAAAAAATAAQQCRALLGCAQVKRVGDDIAGASADLDRAESVAVSHGLKAEEARVHFARGNLCFPRGDIEGCLREHGRSLELARQAGLPELEAEALGGLGDAEYVGGRMISARERFRACIALASGHGLERISCANRPMAAFARWITGETEAALEDARSAIEFAKRIGHKRAEMIGHHAAYFCLHDFAELDKAEEHAEQSLLIAQRLQAPRFEAEGLAFCAELHRLAGRRDAAQSNIEAAIRISRKTGMAFLGPTILGTAALIAEDDVMRREILAEGDALLEAGTVFHNHLMFRRDAIEVCLQMRDWDGAEHHASKLAVCTAAEPLPLSDFFVARGRTLAAIGRSPARANRATLRRLTDQAKRAGYLLALPALRKADELSRE